MWFAYPACKFKGLHLCHQLFCDLMSFFEAIYLKVAREEIEKNCSKDPEGPHSRAAEYLKKLYKSLP